MLHLSEWRPQSSRKWGTLAKTQILSSKISKISLGQVKRMKEESKKQQQAIIEQKVYNNIADVMLGKDFTNQFVRAEKIKLLKQGKFKDLKVTIYPREIEQIGSQAKLTSSISTTVEELQYSLIELYKEKQYFEERRINLQKEAIKRVEENGIVFLDQIDKLASVDSFDVGRSVSREGVQRDLLPIIEGTIVNTKQGDVNTDNILFIACGAFSMTKVQDLMPELLGRLPVRVDMNPITQQQLVRILTEPKFNLLLQQRSLLLQQKIEIQYTSSAIQEIAKAAYLLNLNHENLGARRLAEITEKVIEDISYNCTDYHNQKILIDREFVQDKVKSMVQRKVDLTKALI